MNDPTPKDLKRTLVASAIATLLALPLGYAVAGQSKQPKTTANDVTVLTDHETVADKAGWNDPALAKTASHDGRMLLRQMKDVQTALKVGDVDGARHALKAAKDLTETLKPLMPYEVVSDKVDNAKGKLVESGADVAVDQMLPIYGDVATITAYAPDSHAAAKAKAKQQDMDAVGTDIDATALYLPVLYFESQIDLASKALDRSPSDTGTATQAVDDALSSLVFSQTNLHILPGDDGAETG